jgi:hypothetical protein
MKVEIGLAKTPEDKEDTEAGYQLLLMAIYLVDLVAGLRISPTVATKCEKSRKKMKQEQKLKQ